MILVSQCFLLISLNFFFHFYCFFLSFLHTFESLTVTVYKDSSDKQRETNKETSEAIIFELRDKCRSSFFFIFFNILFIPFSSDFLCKIMRSLENNFAFVCFLDPKLD